MNEVAINKAIERLLSYIIVGGVSLDRLAVTLEVASGKGRAGKERNK